MNDPFTPLLNLSWSLRNILPDILRQEIGGNGLLHVKTKANRTMQLSQMVYAGPAAKPREKGWSGKRERQREKEHHQITVEPERGILRRHQGVAKHATIRAPLMRSHPAEGRSGRDVRHRRVAPQFSNSSIRL